MRDPRFGAPKTKTQKQESFAVSIEQLRLIAEAFERAEDAGTTKRISDMLRKGAFDDIQTVMDFADRSGRGNKYPAITSSAHTMEVLRHFGYTESFVSGEGKDRFSAHMRFKHETRINYFIPEHGDPRTFDVSPIISIVHEFYRQIDGLIDFANERYSHDIRMDSYESARALRDFTELLVEYTHSGNYALSDGIL